MSEYLEKTFRVLTFFSEVPLTCQRVYSFSQGWEQTVTREYSACVAPRMVGGCFSLSSLLQALLAASGQAELCSWTDRKRRFGRLSCLVQSDELQSLSLTIYTNICESPWRQVQTAPLPIFLASLPQRYWECGAYVARRSKDLLSSGRHKEESYRQPMKSRHSGLKATSCKPGIPHEHVQPLVKPAWPQLGCSSWSRHNCMDLSHLCTALQT